MQQIRSFLPLALIVLTLAALIAAFRPGSGTRIAFACTGGPGPFHDTAVDLDLIVVAQAVEVGGPENAAASVTPMPTPDWGGQAPPVTTHEVDLTGISAELEVLQAVGTVPVKLDVDTETRDRVEETLRRIEANPHTILPCPPDFGVWRYEAGKTYLLFLDQNEGGGWYTFLQWEVEGDDVLTGGATYEGNRHALAVTKPVLDAYFEGLPATTFNPQDPESLWVIEQQRVPLEAVLAAVLGLRSGAHPTPTPAAEATAPPVFIAPPSVGDAGLADSD